jgi:hypothetical protein
MKMFCILATLSSGKGRKNAIENLLLNTLTNPSILLRGRGKLTIATSTRSNAHSWERAKTGSGIKRRNSIKNYNTSRRLQWHRQKQMIPGFEEAIIGMSLSESINTTIPADQAYSE